MMNLTSFSTDFFKKKYFHHRKFLFVIQLDKWFEQQLNFSDDIVNELVWRFLTLMSSSRYRRIALLTFEIFEVWCHWMLSWFSIFTYQFSRICAEVEVAIDFMICWCLSYIDWDFSPQANIKHYTKRFRRSPLSSIRWHTTRNFMVAAACMDQCENDWKIFAMNLTNKTSSGGWRMPNVQRACRDSLSFLTAISWWFNLQFTLPRFIKYFGIWYHVLDISTIPI